MVQSTYKAVYLGLLLAPIILLGEEIFHTAVPPGATNTNDPKCIQCHTVSFNDDTMMSVSTYTHGSITDPTFTDPYTVACLTCHNGNDAKNAPVKVALDPSSTTELTFDSIKSHPVLNSYPNGKKEMRSAGSALPGIWNGAETVNDLLRDGKVVCISCHIPHHTKETGPLRASMERSLLCLGCHKY